MKKVFLNRDAFSGIFGELAEIGLVKFRKNGDMTGVGGLSSKPRWDGRWEGYYWTNSSILLTPKGLDILKKSNIKGWELY